MTEIKIGDKVRFLNDIGGGTVTAFQKGGIVLVEDEDGFEIPALQSQVVVVGSNDNKLKPQEPVVPQKPRNAAEVIQEALKARNTPAPKPQEEPDETLEGRVMRLELMVKRLQQRVQQLEDAKALREKVKANDIRIREDKRLHKNDIIEIDLHAEEILDTTMGMDAAAIKDYQMKVFNDTMQKYLKEKGRKIVFIHGNGDGVLRKAIISELNRSYKQVQYQDASFQQYGFGATMVII